MSLNNKAAESKYNVKIPISGVTGVLLNGNSEDIPCHVETQLRVEVTGVGPTNEIQIYGRIRSSSLWHYIATVTGPVTGIADISTYDFIRYFQTVADGTGEITASGFIFNSSSGGGGSATAANQVIANNYLQTINARSSGNLLNDVDFDDFQVAFPDPVTEVYSYYLLGVLQATVEVTYTSSTKTITQRARRI